MEPRDYQREIINKVIEYFKQNNKGILYMPCGTGKTITSYWICKELCAKRTIIAVPSLYLLNQTYNEYIKQDLNVKYLIIGSDFDDNKVKATTDKEYIANFLQNNSDNYVIITTYQSSKLVYDISIELNVKYDLCIYDEAHKTVGSEYREYCSLLKDDVSIDKRLFLTATEKIYNNIDDDILSMNDKNKYGKIIYNYTLKRAIESNYLCDYKIIASIMNNNVINKDNYSAKLYLTADLIIKSFKKYNGISHMLTFSNFNETANSLYNILIEMVKDTDIRVFILSGDDSIRKRKDVVKEFYNCSNAIICSAKIFNEGVNIPIVDSICFTEDKGSEIDIVQCCGRPLRLYPNKKLAYIILPIIVKSEESNIFEDKLDFDNIRTILKALGTIDERIIEELKYNNKQNKILICETNNEENVKQINENIIDLDNYISPILYNRDGESRWDLNLRRLQKFLEDNDNKYPNKSNDIEENKLRNWIKNQRQFHLKLSREQVNKLEELPNWKWFGKKEEKVKPQELEKPNTIKVNILWMRSYNKLQEYIKKYGRYPEHANIGKLYLWRNTQRYKYKRNELSQEQISLLEKIPNWNWEESGYRTEVWNNTYEEYIQYMKDTGYKPLIYNTTNLVERSFIKWIETQRKKYNANKMSEEKIKKLESIPNWSWKHIFKRKIERDEKMQNKKMKI